MFDVAEKILIDMPVGSVVAIGATIGGGRRFYQRQATGVVEISCGAYCRFLSL